jgi:hypothetical protein
MAINAGPRPMRHWPVRPDLRGLPATCSSRARGRPSPRASTSTSKADGPPSTRRWSWHDWPVPASSMAPSRQVVPPFRQAAVGQQVRLFGRILVGVRSTPVDLRRHRQECQRPSWNWWFGGGGLALDRWRIMLHDRPAGGAGRLQKC